MNDDKGQVEDQTKVDDKEQKTETQVAEETKKDTVQSETKSETPQIDAEKLKADITQEVSDKIGSVVPEKIKEAFGKMFNLNKEEKEALPTDADSLKKLVDEKVNEEFERRNKESEEQEKQTNEQRQQQVSDIIGGWYNQYNRAAAENRVPKIENSSDPNDKGVQARRRIILEIDRLNKAAREQGDNKYIASVSDVLLSNPNVLRTPPGGDLPISGNTSVTDNSASFDNKEIRTKSIEEIVRGN